MALEKLRGGTAWGAAGASLAQPPGSSSWFGFFGVGDRWAGGLQ